MLTRHGVCYNLKLSPYKVEIQYGNEKIIYNFSTMPNAERFKNKLQGNRDKINESLSKRFSIELENNKLCDLKLYSVIEKRGFYIECGERNFECLNSLRLNGQNKILKNSTEQ